MSHNAPWDAIIFDYYLNFIPYFANLFSPLFVFIAVIFFTSKLAENSEIIAMFSTGMSFKRMLRPYMVSAGIIAVVTYCLGAYVIPQGSETRLDFEDKYYKPRKANTARNIQARDRLGRHCLHRPLRGLQQDGLPLFAGPVQGQAAGVAPDGALHRLRHHGRAQVGAQGLHAAPDGRHARSISKGARMDTVLQMEPADFLIMKHQQEMMTSPELRHYIARQRQTRLCQRQGVRAGVPQAHRHLLRLVHPDADRRVPVLAQEQGRHGSAPGHRAGLELLVHHVPDHRLHLRRHGNMPP